MAFNNSITHVILTRDAKRFKKLPSLIAPLISQFFSLLSNPGLEATRLRQAFSPALSGDFLPPGHELDPELEPLLKSSFASPPEICLIQGAMRPDSLLEGLDNDIPLTPPGSSDSKSITSNSSNQAQPDLNDVIFLPFVLHQQLDQATKNDDLETKVRVSMMILASVVHEVAHWLYNKHHGYRPDPERRNLLSVRATPFTTQRPDEVLILIGQRINDVGLIATQSVFGYYYKMITWADGDIELVKRRIDGVKSSAQPAMSNSTLAYLLGGPLPNIKDITGFPHSLSGTRPDWADKDDTYLITTQLAPNTLCHHGVVRLGE